MLNPDDARTLDLIDQDYSALERAAEGETRTLFTRRRALLRDLKELLSLNPHAEAAQVAGELILHDFRAMKSSERIGREARMLFARREFALEMLLRRIAAA